MWELYQRGLWHLHKLTKENNEEARNLFRQAVERDPDFALAHAGVAFTCQIDVFHGFADNPAEWLAKGLAAGEDAVALDDKDGFTHYVLGWLLPWTGQGDRAIAEIQKSVALSPSFAHGYWGLGVILHWYGRAADAIHNLDMAMRLSPHDPFLWRMQGARASSCICLENYDEGVEWARKAVNSRANQFWAYIVLGEALAGQGRLDEARVSIENARRVKPDLSLSVYRLLLPPDVHPEYLERWIDLLRKAGLPE